MDVPCVTQRYAFMVSLARAEVSKEYKDSE